MNKPKKNEHVDTLNRIVIMEKKWLGEGKMHKGDQLHGDG